MWRPLRSAIRLKRYDKSKSIPLTLWLSLHWLATTLLCLRAAGCLYICTQPHPRPVWCMNDAGLQIGQWSRYSPLIGWAQCYAGPCVVSHSISSHALQPVLLCSDWDSLPWNRRKEEKLRNYIHVLDDVWHLSKLWNENLPEKCHTHKAI